jgi:alkylated DNA repair dioxygenase AlkB
MNDKVFQSRLAHCNVGPWKRTLDQALKKCDDLTENLLSTEQQESVNKRFKCLVDTPCTICPDMPSGTHFLSYDSSIILLRNMFAFTEDEFYGMFRFMEDVVEPSPNSRNPKTVLKRKQCTFVTPGTSSYEFGQYNQTFRQEIEDMPVLIQRALNKVKHLATMLGVSEAMYNGVHANLYRDGSVGVNPHSDKEQSMVSGLPIFSFTLLSDSNLPRPFSIYTPDKEKLYDINLGQGDILVMCGNMQSKYKHGVEAAKPPKKYKHLKRINFTVRAFLPE